MEFEKAAIYNEYRFFQMSQNQDKVRIIRSKQAIIRLNWVWRVWRDKKIYVWNILMQ